MHYFKVGDKIRLTKKRSLSFRNDLNHPRTGVVIKIDEPSMFTKDRLYICVDHGVSFYTDKKWNPGSLELDDNHRQPCACYECYECSP